MTEAQLGMIEKNKLKRYYGLHERQLVRMVRQLLRDNREIARELPPLCERRLDHVLHLAGLTRSRPQAHQAILHRHVTVNGSPVTTAGYLVQVGDRISITTASSSPDGVSSSRKINQAGPRWLHVEAATSTVVVMRLPVAEEAALSVDCSLIVRAVIPHTESSHESSSRE